MGVKVLMERKVNVVEDGTVTSESVVTAIGVIGGVWSFLLLFHGIAAGCAEWCARRCCRDAYERDGEFRSKFDEIQNEELLRGQDGPDLEAGTMQGIEMAEKDA